jgi:hypothetical protein
MTYSTLLFLSRSIAQAGWVYFGELAPLIKGTHLLTKFSAHYLTHMRAFSELLVIIIGPPYRARAIV